MNIFECASKYDHIIEQVIENDGAIDDELWDELGDVTTNVEHKIKAYRGITLQNEAKIKLYKDEADRLLLKVKALESANDRIKEMAIFAIDKFGQEDNKGVKRLRYNDFSATIRKVKVMDFSDEAQRNYEDEALKSLVNNDTTSKSFINVSINKLDFNDAHEIIDKCRTYIDTEEIKVKVDRRELWNTVKDIEGDYPNYVPEGVGSKVSKSVIYK